MSIPTVSVRVCETGKFRRGATSATWPILLTTILSCREAKGKHSNSNAGDAAFFRAAGDFLCACTPAQVRRAPKPFASLCSSFKSHALNLGQAKRAILPLIAAVRAICPEPGAICPAHADLLQCCLLAKCYSAAGDILAEDPISVDPQATAVTATDVLLYCYYGGMLLTGLRQYTRALDLYLAAITAPTKVLNAITVACLKKFILVTLLHSGKRAQLPKYVAPPVLKALKSECSAYQELAQRAEQGPDAVPAAALAEFVASKQDVWRADGNAGLVQKVVDTAAHRKIQSLTQTYATLGMAKVAEATGLQDANAAELEILRYDF